ncbi:MAG: lysophospholipid acyltransferase (LPLAT)-like uncharacterized protein [Bacteriovoracaceae bacterium]|jgi:lysophospholipid acyltransferase (LPLAT)-like uncharacterized protein
MTKLISLFFYAVARFLSLTYRFRYVGIDNLTRAQKEGGSGGYLLGIWHQNLLPGILSQTGLHYVVIVSRSKDAEPVAYACRNLGHKVVRGSSRKGNVDKGGKAAKEMMIEELKKGTPGSVTVDGPKGPAREVKPGIIDMAKKSGSPLVGFAAISKSYWEFNSWDKFRLPKPFSKIVVAYGEPLMVPADASKEVFESLAKQHGVHIEDACHKASEAFKDWDSLSKENRK